MNTQAKTVLITGGAASIGLAMAEAFIAENARVAICDADSVAIEHLQTRHPDSITRVADVTSERDIASSAVFLASDDGAKISGQVLSIDGHTETLT